MKRWMRMVAVLGMAVSMLAGSAMSAWAAKGDSDEPVQLETPGVWWEDTKAEWDEIEDAYQYEVKIYRDGYRVDTVKTKSTKLECRSRMDRSGEYTFQVRARPQRQLQLLPQRVVRGVGELRGGRDHGREE